VLAVANPRSERRVHIAGDPVVEGSEHVGGITDNSVVAETHTRVGASAQYPIQRKIWRGA